MTFKIGMLLFCFAVDWLMLLELMPFECLSEKGKDEKVCLRGTSLSIAERSFVPSNVLRRQVALIADFGSTESNYVTVFIFMQKCP